MTSLLLTLVLAAASLDLVAGTNVTLPTDYRANSTNCVGIKSCRPRCVAFRLDRSILANPNDCQSAEGIFGDAPSRESTAWDQNTTLVKSCMQIAGELLGDLRIRVSESNKQYWEFATDVLLSPDETDFTFCSIYPCPKLECTLSEQMVRLTAIFRTRLTDPYVSNSSGIKGSILKFEVSASSDPSESTLASIQFGLTKSFEGMVVAADGRNRLGPLQVLWMDDPNHCRQSESMFSTALPPVAPADDPTIVSTLIHYPVEQVADLFCPDAEHQPDPLPWGPKTLLRLRLWFQRPRQWAEEQLEVLERLTRSFVRRKGFAVDRLKITEQELLARNGATNESVTEASVPVDETHVAGIPPELMIEVAMEGRNLHGLETRLRADWQEYLLFLKSSSNLFAAAPEPQIFREWGLLSAAVAMSLVAFGAVLCMRRTSIAKRTLQTRPGPVSPSAASRRASPQITVGADEGTFVVANMPSSTSRVHTVGREQEEDRQVQGTLLYL